MNLNQITLPARDVAASVLFYQTLGFTLIVDSIPRYARFECRDGSATFSLHHVETVPTESGVVIYFECPTLDAQVEMLLGLGVQFDQLPKDERWQWREARLRDPSNNVLCLYWAGENRRYPPWRIAT